MIHNIKTDGMQVTKWNLITPFDNSQKKSVIKKVLQSCTLKTISENNSHEGGFDLQLTPEWKKIIESNDPNREHVKYSATRQLRFVKQNDVIVGIRCMDGIQCWSDSEIMIILQTIDGAIQKI